MKKTILLTILILAVLVLVGAGCKGDGIGEQQTPTSDEPAANPPETNATWGDGTEFNPTWKDYINPVKWFMPVIRTVPAHEIDIPDAPPNAK